MAHLVLLTGQRTSSTWNVRSINTRDGIGRVSLKFCSFSFDGCKITPIDSQCRSNCFDAILPRTTSKPWKTTFEPRMFDFDLSLRSSHWKSNSNLNWKNLRKTEFLFFEMIIILNPLKNSFNSSVIKFSKSAESSMMKIVRFTSDLATFLSFCKFSLFNNMSELTKILLELISLTF